MAEVSITLCLFSSNFETCRHTKCFFLTKASGEAKFISDKIPTADELHCAFVTSTVGNADIDIIDESHAASMKGFVQIIKGSIVGSVQTCERT